MLIPLDDGAHAAPRPTLGEVSKTALPLGDGYGLHAAMDGAHRLLQDGLGTVVHGVGYPHPDRSHFRSRDIWHTADVDFVARSARSTGWLGRAADQLAAAGAALPAMSVGSIGMPLVLAGQHRGTDHGAAALVLVFGQDPAGAQLGKPPSLNDLRDGDLRVTTDFRGIYATILRRLRIDDGAILGATFDGVPLFA